MTEKEENKKELNVDELLKENTALKQANTNIIRFTFSITNSLDETGKNLVKAGNSLFMISEQLKEIINRSNG